MFIETLIDVSKSNSELRNELAAIGFEDRIAARASAPVLIEKSAVVRMPTLISWSQDGIRFVADTESGEVNAYNEHGRSVRTPELMRHFTDAVNDQMRVDTELSGVIRNSSALRGKFN